MCGLNKNRYKQEAFYSEVFEIVKKIPAGRVLTYGLIARLVGFPGYSRFVGKALASAPSSLPCHRVVNSQGRTVPHWPRQKELLLRENIPFKNNGCVDLSQALWEIF